ncbi:MAG: type II toxin-antitoxin system RelE/ParE family toxin [Coriobacteriia bacterium]|nr:type II toxin-antitoxin system RelE/ParE family toxin [Coriobacteriia bacterium]
MSPSPPRMRAKSAFGHSRIWWLLNDRGNCQPAAVLADTRERDRVTYERMLAILDHTDQSGPPANRSQFNPLGGGLVEFKVSKPGTLRLYATQLGSGWVIVYGGGKGTQSRDIATARKRLKALKDRGCDHG